MKCKISSKKAALYNILVSLIAALAIVITSWRYPEYSPESMFIILAIWFVPYSWLSSCSSEEKKK